MSEPTVKIEEEGGLDGATLEQMIAMEDRTQTLCASSPDMAEGVRAFFEKRPPRYDNA